VILLRKKKNNERNRKKNVFVSRDTYIESIYIDSGDKIYLIKTNI